MKQDTIQFDLTKLWFNDGDRVVSVTNREGLVRGQEYIIREVMVEPLQYGGGHLVSYFVTEKHKRTRHFVIQGRIGDGRHLFTLIPEEGNTP
jgi:hypothetical protein